MEYPFVFRLVKLGGAETVAEDVDEMLSELLDELGGCRRIIVGATYADEDPATSLGFTFQGLISRWRATYEPDGYVKMVILAKVTEEDIEGCLSRYEMMPVELARLLERRLDEAIPDEYDATCEEIAGGGRLGKKRRSVGLVYAAIK